MTDLIEHICNEKDPRLLSGYLKQVGSPMLSLIHFFSLKSPNDQGKLIRKLINDIYFKPFSGTMTLTFGDVAESHVGMQKLGKMADHGFSLDDITRAAKYFSDRGCETVIVHLNEYLPQTGNDPDETAFLKQAKTDPEYQAYVLIARGGLKVISDVDELTTEMLLYDWDTKLYNERRDVVQNKNARHNLNFDDESQVADFTQGKGTTVAWETVPILNDIKHKLADIFGPAGQGLKCEGNKYFNPVGTGIGYHGDSERRKVIGVRLGRAMNLHFMWYYNDRPKGYNMAFRLQPGDIYCMSEKTVGTDWRPNSKKGWNKKRYTLRHAAGAPKYTTDTTKIQVRPNNLSTNPNVTTGDIWYKRKAGVEDKKAGIKTRFLPI